MHATRRWYPVPLFAAMLSACAPAHVENRQPLGTPSPESEPGRDWVTVLRISDASHEVDARSVVPGTNGTFALRYRVRMPPYTNPGGERFDRVEGLAEYDCTGRRERTGFTELKLGSTVLRSWAGTGRWERVSGNRREVFRSICAYGGSRGNGTAGSS
jgi:hypothetical protein